jgi:hypothetical protein
MTKRVQEFEAYAWIGRDEFGSGEIGFKQGIVPAGTIPMVSTDQKKLDQYWHQAEAQASEYKHRIYLVKLTITEIIRETQRGKE